MRAALSFALIAAVTAACGDPSTSKFADRDPEPTAQPVAEPEPTAEPEPAAEPEPSAQPIVEPEPQPEAQPIAEPEPVAEIPCMDDGVCRDALGWHGRCAGNQFGRPDAENPENNACVLVPDTLIKFSTPQFTGPAAFVDGLNASLADVWRARGLGFVMRLDDRSPWQRQPDGRWLPEYSGVIFASWDGRRVAPGVEPQRLASQPEVCDDAHACANLIFIDSLSAPLRMPADTEDACAPSPFALFGAAKMKLRVEAGRLAEAELDFGMILSTEVADETPWGDGTVRDVLDALDYPPSVDTNQDGVLNAWELGFVVRAGARDFELTPLSGQFDGDCL